MAGRFDRVATLNAALQHFQAGRLTDAETLIQQVLARHPDDADALHLMGLSRFQKGALDDAIGFVERALAGVGGDANILNNLGQILEAAGRLPDAAERYRQAAADPRFAQAPLNLGNVLARLGEREAASREYRRALDIDPGYAAAHYNLGVLDLDVGDLEPAIESFEAVLAFDPAYPEARNGLGIAYHRKGERARARECFLGEIERNPAFAKAHYNLANVLAEDGELETAIDHYRRAVEIEPGDAAARTNLGQALKDAGRIDEAIEAFRGAIAADADFVEAHKSLGMALLVQGRLAEGWPEYAWRFRSEAQEKRAFLQAPWSGEDVAGKTILAWAEQGVGDEILYAGMVPDLVERGAKVVVECDPRLVPLFGRSFPDVRCIAKHDPPAAEATAAGIDYQISLGNLGQYLRPDLESFPGRRSYLRADAELSREIRERTRDGGDDLLVGLSWFSWKDGGVNRRKSIPLSALRPLAGVSGVRFVNLQYGDSAAERDAFERETGAAVRDDPAIDQIADLDGFAAQVAALDLVITISNVTAHVAGALGVPTWVMLGAVPLNCWMLERDDSPWYPSARLFRQARPGTDEGAWDKVAAAVAEAFTVFVAARRTDGDG